MSYKILIKVIASGSNHTLILLLMVSYEENRPTLFSTGYGMFTDRVLHIDSR